MNKGQVYEGYVERVDFPNKGIVRCEDGTAVVKNVVPGQKISFVVSRKRKGKVEGRMLSVLERAPLNGQMPARILESAAAAVIRGSRMTNSLK